MPQGTLLQLRTSEPVDSKRAKDGEPVQFIVIQDVAIGGVLAIPRGAVVHGVVTESKKWPGDLGGSSVLALTLTSLDLGGASYPLDTDQFKVKGPNKAGQTVGSAIGGGIIGTIIGCAVGRGVGCAIGAGAGVAAGTAASAASPGPGVWIPAEALVTFHLKSPLTVDPVSPQEAARLAQGLYPGGPTLYRRGLRPYGITAYRYPYAYPPVYYRPVLHGGRVLLLEVRSRDQWVRDRSGHPASRMPAVRCGMTVRCGSRTHRRSSKSSVAVVYNDESRIERELRIRGRCPACTSRIVLPSPARRELKVQVPSMIRFLQTEQSHGQGAVRGYHRRRLSHHGAVPDSRPEQRRRFVA